MQCKHMLQLICRYHNLFTICFILNSNEKTEKKEKKAVVFTEEVTRKL